MPAHKLSGIPERTGCASASLAGGGVDEPGTLQLEARQSLGREQETVTLSEGDTRTGPAFWVGSGAQYLVAREAEQGTVSLALVCTRVFGFQQCKESGLEFTRTFN